MLTGALGWVSPGIILNKTRIPLDEYKAFRKAYRQYIGN